MRSRGNKRLKGKACNSRLVLFAIIMWLGSGHECLAQTDTPKPVPAEITFEACLPNQNPLGRPLPLAAHWNTGQFPTGFTPDYQMQMINQGHYLLPWFQLPPPGQTMGAAYYQAAIQQAASLNLPISFLGTQWESLLYTNQYFFNLPPAQNPNVIGIGGTTILPQLDPLGPAGPWTSVGIMWTATQEMQMLQQWYPNPPLVLFVSNNEASTLQWTAAETSQRYVSQYGLGQSNSFKSQVVGNGWIPLYRALQAGMSTGLGPGAWSSNAKYIGYNAFGPSCFARWGLWFDYSLYTTNRIDPSPLMWDGGSPSYYLYDWSQILDYTVWSPQVESMNWIFMQNEAYTLNPNFWFEISTWDGDSSKRQFYASQGQTWNPDRYGGYIKYGMWLLRPRVVREFRSWTDTVVNAGPYFMSVVNAVDAVHNNPVLRKFWRNGQLVANVAQQHPYQSAVPPEYQGALRWFGLDTNLDPQRPWSLGTVLPVYCLALVIGQPPQREWLVYAYSPTQPKNQVQVTLPGYGPITLNALPSGAYYDVVESTHAITPVAPAPQPPGGVTISSGQQAP